MGWSPFRLSQVGPFYLITVGPFWIDKHMRRDNANGMLTLLAEYHSGRFNKEWQLVCKTRA